MYEKKLLRASNKKPQALFVFSHSTHCFDLESNRYDALSAILSVNYGYPVELIQQPRPDLRSIEEDLFIAPVSVLKQSENSGMSWGVFVKKDLICHGERLLGQYLGELKQSGKSKRQNAAFDYTFDFTFDFKIGGHISRPIERKTRLSIYILLLRRRNREKI